MRENRQEKNRHNHRSKICAAGQQKKSDDRFQPMAAGTRIFTTMHRGLNRDGASSQQHGIDRSEIVVLAV